MGKINLDPRTNRHDFDIWDNLPLVAGIRKNVRNVRFHVFQNGQTGIKNNCSRKKIELAWQEFKKNLIWNRAWLNISKHALRRMHIRFPELQNATVLDIADMVINAKPLVSYSSHNQDIIKVRFKSIVFVIDLLESAVITVVTYNGNEYKTLSRNKENKIMKRNQRRSAKDDEIKTIQNYRGSKNDSLKVQIPYAHALLIMFAELVKDKMVQAYLTE